MYKRAGPLRSLHDFDVVDVLCTVLTRTFSDD
jgi:hypothetical protein